VESSSLHAGQFWYIFGTRKYFMAERNMLLQWDRYCGEVAFWYLVSFLLFFLPFLSIYLVYNVVLHRRVSRELRTVHPNVCRSLFDMANRTVGREPTVSFGEVCSGVREADKTISKLSCLNRRVSRRK